LDLAGKAVMRMEVQPGINLYQFDISHLSRGMYIIYWLDAGILKGWEKLVFIR